MSTSLFKIFFLRGYSLEYPLACLLLDIISWSQPFLRALTLSSESSCSEKKTTAQTAGCELVSNDPCK